jgi:hypothetical protein
MLTNNNEIDAMQIITGKHCKLKSGMIGSCSQRTWGGVDSSQACLDFDCGAKRARLRLLEQTDAKIMEESDRRFENGRNLTFENASRVILTPNGQFRHHRQQQIPHRSPSPTGRDVDVRHFDF